MEETPRQAHNFLLRHLRNLHPTPLQLSFSERANPNIYSPGKAGWLHLLWLYPKLRGIRPFPFPFGIPDKRGSHGGPRPAGGRQPPTEPRNEALLEISDFLRRPVRADYDLLMSVVEGIEGVEKLFLR